MSFEVESPSETQAKVRILVPKDEIQNALAHELGDIQGRARIPGFRPGKVPKALLKKKLGTSLEKDVRRRLLAEAFEQGIQERHLHPVEPPPLKDEDLELKEDGSLQVEFELEVIPHFELGGYEQFSVKPPPIELKEEDVDRELEGLRRQAATAEPIVDGLTASGDVVIADLVLQFLDGTSLPPFEARIIDTGAGLVDGVACEDAKTKFTGAKRGDVVKVTMKLPEQFPIAEHRGKTAVTDCTVKDLRRVALPELDSSDFATRFGAKDLADLRAKVGERLRQLLKQERDRVVEEMCVDQLIDRNPFPLPAGFLQRTLDAERERIRKDAEGQGAPPEQIERHLLEHEGRLKTDVERRLRSTWLLDRVAEQTEVAVSSQELEQQIVLLARAWQTEPQKLFDQFQANGMLPRLVEDIRRAKVRRQLRETAAPAENDAVTSPQPPASAASENAQ